MLRKIPDAIEDDTEAAPWMVMGTPQWDAIKRFAPGLAPDELVADAPIRPRTSHGSSANKVHYGK